MRIKSFGIFPAIAIVILSVGLVNHVLSIPLLLNIAYRDAWISVLVAILIMLPWLAFPLYGVIRKLERKPIDQWLKQRLHPVIAWTVIGCFLLLLLSIALETLIVTASWTATTYLPNTPPFVIAIVFLGLCLYASVSGMRTIAYMSCLLLPLVVFLGDFVMTTNMPHKDYLYLLPMLENGMPQVIKASIISMTAFSEMFTLLFIQHHLKGDFKRWHLILVALFLTLITIGPLIGAISEFGPIEAEKMQYPAFAQWRLVSIGRYFEHVDFLAIFQWLSGSLIRLSLALHIITEFSPFGRLRRRWIFPSLLAAAMAAPAYYGIHNMLIYYEVLRWKYQYIGYFSIGLVILVWGISFQKRNGNDPLLKNSSEEDVMK
ncbi:GerAB/ArcD/ProY family transporter [Paenibacillus harenae]|uniref:GerAB/ArcD/ProY family transporter n=1 Tax=Paenibacillus harenae TaxID=306543 RepID=UPI00040F6353|nr:endospore germination permease [Paenibacillus harenae]